MAAAKGRTNGFAIGVTAAVVAVLIVLVGVVVFLNNKATDPGEKPVGSHITDTGGIVFGDSKTNTVTTYVDFLCPICNQFEQSEGDTIKQQVDSGKSALQVQPVSILDSRTSPAGYSSRAASAMYSVAIHDYKNAYAFMQALYAGQPQEGSAGLTDDQIIDIAKQAGVNVTSDLEKEIKAHKYQKWAQAAQLPQGASGTPTLVINGKQIPVTMNPNADILPHLK
ncbi:DsbA family protein [Microbacterium sp. ASV81]|uniref:Thioredoxin domain-containing protein n=1 Tax=Microbacterium capsulatum TaxID=3041921 RepID=A0ABU0XGG6_9MICO|nr:thioredoxin domain-containing protein [Microbacterium sp. ASV81]MDQ4214216.1 thioredoxin domain-containing protein [Microbacterium sp. ASV81]